VSGFNNRIKSCAMFRAYVFKHCILLSLTIKPSSWFATYGSSVNIFGKNVV
jgi:hypothetical protein